MSWTWVSAFQLNWPKVQVKLILSIFHSWCGSNKERGRQKTELACLEVRKHSKKQTADYLPTKENRYLRAHASARSPPALLCAHLADQLGYPQGSVDLLQAIEVPQGQVQLVQESAFVTWRLRCRMWTQQVIWRVAERLPVKRQTSSQGHGKASWLENIFFFP